MVATNGSKKKRIAKNGSLRVASNQRLVSHEEATSKTPCSRFYETVSAEETVKCTLVIVAFNGIKIPQNTYNIIVHTSQIN
jgi:hypothetical protein